MSTPSTRELAAITRHPETEAFQTHAGEGRFVVPRCASCGRWHWYPRALCPFCFSDDLKWEAASGQGTVYSYTVMRRAKPVYCIAYVRLDEGPVMMTNIVDVPMDEVRIGMPVQVVFEATVNGQLVPMFRGAP